MLLACAAIPARKFEYTPFILTVLDWRSSVTLSSLPSQRESWNPRNMERYPLPLRENSSKKFLPFVKIQPSPFHYRSLPKFFDRSTIKTVFPLSLLPYSRDPQVEGEVKVNSKKLDSILFHFVCTRTSIFNVEKPPLTPCIEFDSKWKILFKPRQCNKWK